MSHEHYVTESGLFILMSKLRWNRVNFDKAINHYNYQDQLNHFTLIFNTCLILWKQQRNILKKTLIKNQNHFRSQTIIHTIIGCSLVQYQSTRINIEENGFIWTDPMTHHPSLYLPATRASLNQHGSEHNSSTRPRINAPRNVRLPPAALTMRERLRDLQLKRDWKLSILEGFGWCPSDGVDGFPHISRIPESESIPSGTFVCHPHAKSTRFKDSYKADF